MPPKDKAEKARYDKQYWAIPKNKERRRQKNFLRYISDRGKAVVLRHASEMRIIIKTLVGAPLCHKGVSLEDLYEAMVGLIETYPEKAKEKFPHGVPDASDSRVEFKVGFDRLFRDQLVNNTRLFESYKDFIMWRHAGRK